MFKASMLLSTIVCPSPGLDCLFMFLTVYPFLLGGRHFAELILRLSQ